jgi:hypothetical protein
MPDDKKPMEVVVHPDGTIEVVGAFPVKSQEELAEAKRISTQCGHVKRRLVRNERLTRKTLAFALTVVGEDSEIGEKLKAGTPLTEYELHLVVDVWLLHTRLGA